LREEIRRYHASGFAVSSVYVGGGTPTVAPGELLATLALVRELYGERETSVETNPRDLCPELLARLRDAGVSRLSVGVQSFDDRLLTEMDRYAKYGSSAEIARELQAAAGYFDTLNVDMIFNQPHQTPASLARDIETILGLGVNQASFYPLMTTRSTERKLERVMGLPDRWRVRPYYETILARLRPTFQAESAWCFSRGKAAIDEYFVDAEDYIGVGSGAFSYLDGTMYATTFSINGYIERIEAGESAVTGQRKLTDSEQMKQSFLVRLFGLALDKSWVRARFGDRFERELGPAIRCFELAGALRQDAARYWLTERGMYFWVLMMSSFFESVNGFREQMRERIAEEIADHGSRV
jgi:coproporphyrinogen III oxidase-like Fe-S oxidoreductase